MSFLVAFWDPTFEKVDLLPPVVTVSRQGERCIYVIRDLLKPNTDFSRVVIFQHTIVEPPVLVPLMRVLIQTINQEHLWETIFCTLT